MDRDSRHGMADRETVARGLTHRSTYLQNIPTALILNDSVHVSAHVFAHVFVRAAIVLVQPAETCYFFSSTTLPPHLPDRVVRLGMYTAVACNTPPPSPCLALPVILCPFHPAPAHATHATP